MSAEDLFRVEGLCVRPAEPGPDGRSPTSSAAST